RLVPPIEGCRLPSEPSSSSGCPLTLTIPTRVTCSLPSRPGEFHPEPLTEPDVSLSTYPARATHGRLPPSAKTSRFLPLPVDLSIPTPVTCPFAPRVLLRFSATT